jgi:hypothetical protein
LNNPRHQPNSRSVIPAHASRERADILRRTQDRLRSAPTGKKLDARRSLS